MEEQIDERHATLIDLLDSWGIDLRNGSSAPVRVLRHAGDEGAAHRFYNLGSEEFEWYQGSQNTLKFGNARILISFIGVEGNQADLVGIYRVRGVAEARLNPPFVNSTPPDLLKKCDTRFHYQLARATEFDPFRERIRIDWDSPANNWVLAFPYANKTILSIRKATGELLVPHDRNSLLMMGLLPIEVEPALDDFDSYKEGGRTLRSHFTIERNAALVQDSKERFKKLHGRLFCQACGFDFFAVYGEDYIECHHKIPVHKLPSNGFTNIDDVVLLCSNCHRIIHRRKEWMSLDQLRDLLENRKKS